MMKAFFICDDDIRESSQLAKNLSPPFFFSCVSLNYFLDVTRICLTSIIGVITTFNTTTNHYNQTPRVDFLIVA